METHQLLRESNSYSSYSHVIFPTSASGFLLKAYKTVSGISPKQIIENIIENMCREYTVYNMSDIYGK